MKVGDYVCDIVGLKGRVMEIKPGLVCMVRVQWLDHATWIKASYLASSPDRTAEGKGEELSRREQEGKKGE